MHLNEEIIHKYKQILLHEFITMCKSGMQKYARSNTWLIKLESRETESDLLSSSKRKRNK